MNPIILIALAVFATAIAFYFIRLGMDKRKLEKKGVQNSIEDAERRKRMSEPWPSRSSKVERAPYKREAPGSTPGGTKDDDTKTWPGPPATV